MTRDLQRSYFKSTSTLKQRTKDHTFLLYAAYEGVHLVCPFDAGSTGWGAKNIPLRPDGSSAAAPPSPPSVTSLSRPFFATQQRRRSSRPLPVAAPLYPSSPGERITSRASLARALAMPGNKISGRRPKERRELTTQLSRCPSSAPIPPHLDDTGHRNIQGGGRTEGGKGSGRRRGTPPPLSPVRGQGSLRRRQGRT